MVWWCRNLGKVELFLSARTAAVAAAAGAHVCFPLSPRLFRNVRSFLLRSQARWAEISCGFSPLIDRTEFFRRPCVYIYVYSAATVSKANFAYAVARVFNALHGDVNALFIGAGRYVYSRTRRIASQSLCLFSLNMRYL